MGHAKVEWSIRAREIKFTPDYKFPQVRIGTIGSAFNELDEAKNDSALGHILRPPMDAANDGREAAVEMLMAASAHAFRQIHGNLLVNLFFLG